jgi:hypothetical protein
MTLAGMRAHGIRSVQAYCEAIGCGHEAILIVDELPDELPVPDVGPRLRCSKCGSRAIQTRPNWVEMQVPAWPGGRLSRRDHHERLQAM